MLRTQSTSQNNSLMPRIPATAVYGALDKAERRLRLNAFREGRIKVLTSADLISEGFDLPRIETAILLQAYKKLGAVFATSRTRTAH